MRRDVYDSQLGTFVEMDVIEESEWRPELDAAEDLTDEEREAAAKVLRRLTQPPAGVDPGGCVSLASIRQAIALMSASALRIAPAMRNFAQVANQLGRHCWPVSRSASPAYHAFVHPKQLERLVPDEPMFPAKVKGATVIPGIGRTCTDPRLAQTGQPIWLNGRAAPLPLDQLSAPRTFTGQQRKSSKLPLRCGSPRSARVWHRKQRR